MTIQTVFTSLYIYYISKNVWISLTLILVIVGGLMISFVYVSSLIPAEPYTRTFIWVSPVVIIPFCILLINGMKYQFIGGDLEYTPINLFNSKTYWGILLIVGVLIVTLLIVCVNTLSIKSPMRSYS